MNNSKKGVSPVVATVILIMIVVIIGIAIFSWFRGFSGEIIEKQGKNIELVCQDVSFDASHSANTLFVSNTGNVPIYSINLKFSFEGNHETKNIRDISLEWPREGLNQEQTFEGSVNDEGSKSITVIPILLGTSKGKDKSFECGEEFGVEIIL